MKVFTYFDANQAREGDGDLLRLWRLSWERRGWETRLLTPRQAKGHPNFKKAPDQWASQAYEQAGGQTTQQQLWCFNVINFGLEAVEGAWSFPADYRFDADWSSAKLVSFRSARDILACGRRI